MRAVSTILFFLLAGIAGSARSQTCGNESGKADEICREYCESLTCQLADDGDSDTRRRGSARECDRLGKRFESLTGRKVPCEEANTCPCLDSERWPDPEAGSIWADFAEELYDADDTTCIDEGSILQLSEQIVDMGITRAGVDVFGSECQVWLPDHREPVGFRVSERQARACLRILRRSGGDLCR